MLKPLKPLIHEDAQKKKKIQKAEQKKKREKMEEQGNNF